MSTAVVQAGYRIMESDTCCVCSASYSLSKTLDVVGIHFEKVFICGKVCEQALIQAVAFVQGFLLGKVVSSCVQTSHINDSGFYEKDNSSDIKEEPTALTTGDEIYAADEPSVYFDDVDLSLDPDSKPSPPNNLGSESLKVKQTSSGKYETSRKSSAKKQKVNTKVRHKPKQHTMKSRNRQLSTKQGGSRRGRTKQNVEEATVENEETGMSLAEEASHRSRTQVSDKSMPLKIRMEDDMEVSETSDTTDKEWEVSCPHCGKGFNNTKTMKAHVRMKHQKNVKVCRVCGQKCYGQIGLSLHMKSKHAGEKANECDICKERFPYSTDLERHVTLVHGKDRFICHICGKHFRYWHTLQSHVKAHSGVRAYVCEHCGKGFLRGNTLIDHKKSHFCRVCKKKLISGQCPDHPKPRYTYNYQSGLSLLQCKECSAVFESVDALEDHVKTHVLQRPFRCQVCGKGFHTSQHLYKHSKQHEEKQFQCGVCAKKFTYKCNMQKHQETHAEDRPFSCEFCSRTFKTKRALDTHLPRHIEERQFKCHICGKGLTRRAKLKEHLQKMHPVT